MVYRGAMFCGGAVVCGVSGSVGGAVRVDAGVADRPGQPRLDDEESPAPPALQSATGQLRALGEAGEPAAGAGQREVALDDRIAHPHDEFSAGAALDPKRDRGLRRVFAGVRQCLLHDPVGVAAHRLGRWLRCLRRGGQVDDRLESRAGGPLLIDEGVEVGEGRLGPVAVVGAVVLGAGCGAQDAEHVAQVAQGLVGRGLDDVGGLGALLRREIPPVGQGAGVHRDEGDPVREHVVHFARDGGPLVGSGLIGAQALLALGRLGALAQCRDEVAAGTDIPARRDDDPGEERHEGDEQERRSLLDSERRAVVGEGAGQSRDEDRRHVLPAPSRPQRDHRDEACPAGRRGDAGDEAERKGDREREAPAPPQQHDGDHAEREPDQRHGAVPVGSTGLHEQDDVHPPEEEPDEDGEAVAPQARPPGQGRHAGAGGGARSRRGHLPSVGNAASPGHRPSG